MFFFEAFIDFVLLHGDDFKEFLESVIGCSEEYGY
jgi:hypothetical protein